jgi:superfamily I DNA/RNA helicase
MGKRFTTHIRTEQDTYNRLVEIKNAAKLVSFDDVLKYMFNELSDYDDLKEKLQQTKDKSKVKVSS